jgi:multisubunit Na+/H+ antiporter MnhG subunit
MLSGMLDEYSTSNLGGGLARLIGMLITRDELVKDGLVFIGYGLNIYGYVSVKRYADIFDFGFFPFMLSSFGVIISVLGIIVVAIKAKSFLNDKSGMGFIFIPAFFATLTNSAGGLHAYALPMLMLIWGVFGIKDE